MPQELYIHDVSIRAKVDNLPKIFATCGQGWIPRAGLSVDLLQPGPVFELQFEAHDNIWPLHWDEVREHIAPYIMSGSYIVAESEGQVFKWLWENGTCRTIPGRLEFVEE